MKPSADTRDIRQEQFDELQRRLRPLWEHIGRSDPGSHSIESPNTVVVVPSITYDLELPVDLLQAYEERMLFMLFLLRQPHIRMVYLTSLPVAPEIVNYYLDVLPSVTASHAAKRLHMVSADDRAPMPLVSKLLGSPALLQMVRDLVGDVETTHMVPFLTTDLERDLALELGIPMYAADPQHFDFGTKTGCRQIFVEEDVPHPIGAQDLRGESELTGAVQDMRRRKPGITRAIVKHNDGVSGFGNATLDLTGLVPPGSPDEVGEIKERLTQMAFELDSLDYTSYMSDFERLGGVVEEFVGGEEVRSPSAQLRITPFGEVEELSTHDQILGGPTGQIFLGASFPADEAYGAEIMRESAKIGRRLAREGIVGRFAVDFMLVRDGSGWSAYAIEINLRKGGTTHPYLALQYLTDGSYDSESCCFLTGRGERKYYVATDNLKSPAYEGLSPDDLFDLVSRTRLHFDHARQTGVLLHMVSAITRYGRTGLTAIGNSREEAEEIYRRFVAELDGLAGEPPR